jgi:hypothetical protein
MSFKEKINGPRKVKHGKIVQTDIETLEEAKIIKERLENINPGIEFEITGVSENYKIIQRDTEASTSTYLDD